MEMISQVEAFVLAEMGIISATVGRGQDLSST